MAKVIITIEDVPDSEEFTIRTDFKPELKLSGPGSESMTNAQHLALQVLTEIKRATKKQKVT